MNLSLIIFIIGTIFFLTMSIKLLYFVVQSVITLDDLVLDKYGVDLIYIVIMYGPSTIATTLAFCIFKIIFFQYIYKIYFKNNYNISLYLALNTFLDIIAFCCIIYCIML